MSSPVSGSDVGKVGRATVGRSLAEALPQWNRNVVANLVGLRSRTRTNCRRVGTRTKRSNRCLDDTRNE
jgi:hypothetical protein